MVFPTPSQWPVVAANALLVGILCATFVTSLSLLSPTVVALASTLTVPLCYVCDSIFHHDSFPPLGVLGSIIVVAGFLLFELPHLLHAWNGNDANGNDTATRRGLGEGGVHQDRGPSYGSIPECHFLNSVEDGSAVTA